MTVTPINGALLRTVFQVYWFDLSFYFKINKIIIFTLHATLRTAMSTGTGLYPCISYTSQISIFFSIYLKFYDDWLVFSF